MCCWYDFHLAALLASLVGSNIDQLFDFTVPMPFHKVQAVAVALDGREVALVTSGETVLILNTEPRHYVSSPVSSTRLAPSALPQTAMS
jgi:hypothetical protein